MAIRKKAYIPKSFESMGKSFIDDEGKKRADTSANIYESLLVSKAFTTLTDRQKVLYVVCKSQFYGHRKPEKDFPEIESLQGTDLFYLNWSAVQKRYCLYTEKSHSNFYKDMKALCEHGLIKKVSSGASQRKKTIYQFSSDWKDWKE